MLSPQPFSKVLAGLFAQRLRHRQPIPLLNRNRGSFKTEILESRTLLSGDIDLTGYNLTFADEFNTASVTSTLPKGAATWYYWPPYGAGGGYSSSNWNASAFSASNGIVSDKAWQDSSGKWQSGNLSSMDSTGAGFAQQYGYFELRAKMPDSGTGSWPAFWLMTKNSIPAVNQPTVNEEIDIFEWYGSTQDNATGVTQQASHNWKTDGTVDTTQPRLYQPSTPIPDGAQPWSGYHTYGVQVDPSHITWYIDGTQTNQIATPTPYMSSPFYIMIDYALGGGWPLSGVVNNSHLDLDWVHVYSLPSQPPTVTNLNPASDSFIKDGTPTTNYGTQSTMEVRSSGSTYLRKAYLKFDMSALPRNATTVASLALNFTVGVGGARTYQLYGITDGVAGEDFSETGITWNNAVGNNGDGSFNSNATLLATATLFTGATTVVFSSAALTSFINADTNNVLTFAVYKGSNTGLDSIASREAASGQPVLQVTTQSSGSSMASVAKVSTTASQRPAMTSAVQTPTASSAAGFNWIGASTAANISGVEEQIESLDAERHGQVVAALATDFRSHSIWNLSNLRRNAVQ